MNKPILLKGPAGSGKTFLAKKITEASGEGLFINSSEFLLGDSSIRELINKGKPSGWFHFKPVKVVVIEEFRYKHADTYLTLFREFDHLIFILTTQESHPDLKAVEDSFSVIECTYHLKGGKL